MLFNSWTFVGFAIAVLTLYYALGKRLRTQNAMLLVASYVFYGAWDWRFLSLIAVSTVVDFVVARRLGALDGTDDGTEALRRRWLWTSIATNLGILGFFKYFGFFADSLRELLAIFGLQLDPLTLQIVLPVGISFYTFQTMSYTIDVYRRRLKPTDDFLNFALFVAFFPQLVAGPIERASHLLPQIERPRRVTAEDIDVGIYLILWGFVLKIAIADNAALIVQEVYGAHTTYGGLDLVLATVAFAVQIYGDFSGYSKIARGVARLMGFDLMVNFRIPYAATSPSDFWERWHISLSSWLREYLYFSLGGNREGTRKTYRNLLLTMLLGGLWHGAAWNFVLWGAYHGLLLILYRFVGGLEWVKRALNHPSFAQVRSPIAVVVMFAFTLYGWLLFRATSLTQVIELTTGIFTRDAVAAGVIGTKLLTIAWPLVLFEVLQHNARDLLAVTKFTPAIRGFLYAFFFVWLALYGVREPIEFIYFAF